MDTIEVESIEDVSVEINDSHSRSWSDMKALEHNFPTIEHNDDSIIIKHKGNKIVEIVSDRG